MLKIFLGTDKLWKKRKKIFYLIKFFPLFKNLSQEVCVEKIFPEICSEFLWLCLYTFWLRIFAERLIEYHMLSVCRSLIFLNRNEESENINLLCVAWNIEINLNFFEVFLNTRIANSQRTLDLWRHFYCLR